MKYASAAECRHIIDELESGILPSSFTPRKLAETIAYLQHKLDVLMDAAQIACDDVNEAIKQAEKN